MLKITSGMSFSPKNPQVKDEWMKAFQRERERVKEDDEKGKLKTHTHIILWSTF